MNVVTLKNLSESGQKLEAKFDPSKGMNLISFVQDSFELIDQNTKDLFDERAAGLGALIGPHFHHRKEDQITSGFDDTLFPHIEKVRAKGVKEPFSHGIARYVPWKYQASETQIEAWLTGKDLYHKVPLKEFEGQDFEMHMHAHLIHDGLVIDLKIHSEKPSLVGFHYYYTLHRNSTVEAFVEGTYRDQDTWKDLPDNWYDKEKHKLSFDLDQEADYGFKPSLQSQHPYHKILVRSPKHLLHVEFTSSNEEETSWQLYHPKGESFVCVEPLSALNPREPRLTTSNLQLKISSNKM